MFLVEIPQKVENINRAICFAFIFLPLLLSVLVRNLAISSSDPPFFVHFILRSLVSNQIYHRSVSFAIKYTIGLCRFQSNIPSVSVVSNQIYHRIDGFLLGLPTSCSATSSQLLVFRATFCNSSNSKISEQLLVRKLAAFHISQCFSRQFMNFL